MVIPMEATTPYQRYKCHCAVALLLASNPPANKIAPREKSFCGPYLSKSLPKKGAVRAKTSILTENMPAALALLQPKESVSATKKT